MGSRFSVGDTSPTLTHEITYQDIARYSGASNDFNLPHVDPEFASDAGYDSTIAMGMLPGGIAGTLAHQWFNIKFIRSFTVRFEDIVYPGDELCFTGEIVAVEDERVVAELSVTNQNDEVVLSGRIEATDE
jgi:acyl dehydratase